MMSVKKIRTFGGSRKCKAVEVWKNLFQWFMDLRTSLKPRLPKSLFRLPANNFTRTCWNRTQMLKMKINFCFQTNGSLGKKKDMEFTCTYQTSVLQYSKMIVLWGLKTIFKISGGSDSISWRFLVLIYHFLMATKCHYIEMMLWEITKFQMWFYPSNLC